MEAGYLPIQQAAGGAGSPPCNTFNKLFEMTSAPSPSTSPGLALSSESAARTPESLQDVTEQLRRLQDSIASLDATLLQENVQKVIGANCRDLHSRSHSALLCAPRLSAA